MTSFGLPKAPFGQLPKPPNAANPSANPAPATRPSQPAVVAKVVHIASSVASVEIDGQSFRLELPNPNLRPKTVELAPRPAAQTPPGTSTNGQPTASSAAQQPNPLAISTKSTLAVDILGFDGNKLKQPVPAILKPPAPPAVDVSRSQPTMPATASITGQPGATPVKISIGAAPMGDLQQSPVSTPNVRAQGATTPTAGNNVAPQTSTGPNLQSSSFVQQAKAQPPQELAARPPPTPSSTPQTTATVATPSSKLPAAMPTPGPQAPASSGTPPSDGIVMAVSERSPEGRVALQREPLQIRPQQPLAGLELGAQVAVRVLAPQLAVNGDMASSFDKILSHLAAQISRGGDDKPRQLSTERLTRELVAQASPKLERTPAPTEKLSLNLLDFLQSDTEAGEPSRAANSPASEAVARREGAALEGQTSGVRSREEALAATHQRPQDMADIEREMRIRDEQEDGQAASGTASERLKITLNLSQLGRTIIDIAVFGTVLRATVDSEGTLDHASRAEIADLFGAGVELSDLNGYLQFRFPRPGDISA